MTRFENIADQTIRLTQAEAVQRIDGTNACGILPTVLEHR
jgi:hypothetical protein